MIWVCCIVLHVTERATFLILGDMIVGGRLQQLHQACVPIAAIIVWNDVACYKVSYYSAKCINSFWEVSASAEYAIR